MLTPIQLRRLAAIRNGAHPNSVCWQPHLIQLVNGNYGVVAADGATLIMVETWLIDEAQWKATPPVGEEESEMIRLLLDAPAVYLARAQGFRAWAGPPEGKARPGVIRGHTFDMQRVAAALSVVPLDVLEVKIVETRVGTRCLRLRGFGWTIVVAEYRVNAERLPEWDPQQQERSA